MDEHYPYHYTNVNIQNINKLYVNWLLNKNNNKMDKYLYIVLKLQKKKVSKT